jgi:hypothetical protein
MEQKALTLSRKVDDCKLLPVTCSELNSIIRISLPWVERRTLNVRAKFERSLSYCSYKCLFPGAFNVGLIGSTCPDLPGWS